MIKKKATPHADTTELDQLRAQVTALNLECTALQKTVTQVRAENDTLHAAQDALRQSEARFRDLADSITDVFFALDHELRYTYWNKAYEQLTGITAADALGKSLFELFPGLRGTQIEEMYMTALRTRQPQHFLNNYQVAGKENIFEINVYPTSNGFTVFSKDMSAWKKIEEQLLIKDFALNSAASAIGIADLNGTIIFVNKAFAAMWEYSDTEAVVGRKIVEFTQSKELFQQVMESIKRDDGFIGEGFSARKDGSIFPVQIIANMVKNPDGKPICIMASFVDLTQQKKAETELRKSEERFRMLFVAMIEGVALHELVDDAAGQPCDYSILDVNDAFVTHTGIARQAAIGKKATELYGTKEAPFFAEYCHVAQTGVAIRFETYFAPMAKHFGISVFALGQRQFATVFEDITQRKLAETAIRDSEERFRALFEGSPDAIILADMETGKIIDVNSAAVDLLQRSRADIIGMPQTAIHPPETVVQTKKNIAGRKTEKHPVAVENVILRADGSRVPVEIRGQMLTLQGKKVLQGVFRNTTERKKTELLLRENEERFRRMFDQSPVSVAIVDLNFHFVRANQAMCQFMGYTESELNALTFKEITHPDHVNDDIENVERVKRGEIDHYSTDKRYVRKDGHIVWGSMSLRLIKDENGQPLYFLPIIQDISARKQSELLIEASLKEKEALLRELYHRTKNNMQIICALLSLQASAANNETVARVFKEMENRIHSMALVHQKLYQSHNLSNINLDEYIRELADLLLKSYQVSSRFVALAFDLENLAVPIDIALPCGLIINELISNIFKHAFRDRPVGEIRIALHRLPGQEIELSIADNGVGVPPGYDMRANSKMGLQSVYSIGELQLQGRISMRSDNGLAFTLVFKDAVLRSVTGEKR